MLALQTGCIAAAALISIVFGLRYLLAREFMGYHATVAGRSWAELTTGIQAMVLGMYTIMGGGFLTYGAALLWLLVPLLHGERWAALAALTVTATTLAPALYVTVWLRSVQPAARTPVLPAVVVCVLAVVGAGASFLT
jgi:hypothetical protein